MYIHGDFVNQKRQIISVHIVTGNDKTKEIEIGVDGGDIFFTDDPVSISSQVNDTFDHLLLNQASINLLTRNYIPELFCNSCKDAVVNIYRDSRCIFAGYIEPRTFSQDYNEVYDELEISCIDALSALQYSKYKNIGAPKILYSNVKSSAVQRAFSSIIKDILYDTIYNLDLGAQIKSFLYDGSKAIDNEAGNKYKIFDQLQISELLFLGDTEDDVWQQNEVLEEILRYLNLHIVQIGFTFYIFSWETLKSNDIISWQDIYSGRAITDERKLLDITADVVYGDNTQISIDETYNTLLLKCDVKSIESLIKSPLDDDLLISPFSNKQKYMTEYSSDGEGVRAYNAFYAMTHDTATDYDGGRITDWYAQIMSNKEWTFGAKGTDLIARFCKSNINQQQLLNLLGSGPGAAIISLGSVSMNTNQNDNSLTSKVDMTNYLVISVNGNKVDNDEEKTYPSEKALKDNIPYAVYHGNVGGGVLSPSDDKTTNYIVLSGDIILNPVIDTTDSYNALHNITDWGSKWWHHTVPSRDNGDGRYYTQQFFKADNPNAKPAWDDKTITSYVPFIDKGPEEYEFKYSAVGDRSDKISKISVLSCMLIVGDKCVVETGTSGQITDFSWQTYKTLEQCADEDEYYQQSFTIGFDPKIGDKLIGNSFSMQNNIDYSAGIDAEGIAIKITRGDHLSGAIKFMILGPVNTTWGVISRRHPTCFRHTKWSEDTVPLLAHVGSIMLKSFDVKVYSDNGLINNTDDSDLVYMSDTQETFMNKKDDLEFKLNSALTTEECQVLGVTNTLNLSTPLNSQSGVGLLNIYDYNKKQQAKAEQLYVDSYYQEYHTPKILMTQTLQDDANIVNLFTHYRHPALDKTFFVQGISHNLIEGSAEMNLKEI